MCRAGSVYGVVYFWFRASSACVRHICAFACYALSSCHGLCHTELQHLPQQRGILPCSPPPLSQHRPCVTGCLRQPLHSVHTVTLIESSKVSWHAALLRGPNARECAVLAPLTMQCLGADDAGPTTAAEHYEAACASVRSAFDDAAPYCQQSSEPAVNALRCVDNHTQSNTSVTLQCLCCSSLSSELGTCRCWQSATFLAQTIVTFFVTSNLYHARGCSHLLEGAQHARTLGINRWQLGS